MTAVENDLTAPVLLMAMPQVLDPYFHRSVILLIHHDEEGSFGYIINRPTGIRITEILQGMNIGWNGSGESHAYFGGPVQPQLGSVLYSGATDAQSTFLQGGAEVCKGVTVTQHLGDLETLAQGPPASFRLLLGYAGWGDGQLMDEILRNDWLTAPVNEELIFGGDPDEVWPAAVRSVGVDPASLPSWTPTDPGAGAN